MPITGMCTTATKTMRTECSIWQIGTHTILLWIQIRGWIEDFFSFSEIFFLHFCYILREHLQHLHNCWLRNDLPQHLVLNLPLHCEGVKELKLFYLWQQLTPNPEGAITIFWQRTMASDWRCCLSSWPLHIRLQTPATGHRWLWLSR